MYAANPAPLIVHDDEGHLWTVPAKPITRLDADVAERWFINVALPATAFRSLVPAPFLVPDLRHGLLCLSLCRIRMRHGAPAWAPLALGPACDNAALRIGCRDARDGSPAVWVAGRCTTHVLGALLARLGFPPVDPCLRVTRSDAQGLHLERSDGQLRVCAGPGRAPPPRLFADGNELTDWVTAGVRSYAEAGDGRYLVVDLEKGSPNAFAALPGWQARLHTPWGTWIADGVYRTENGHYQWRVLGAVDQHGKQIGAQPPVLTAQP